MMRSLCPQSDLRQSLGTTSPYRQEPQTAQDVSGQVLLPPTRTPNQLAEPPPLPRPTPCTPPNPPTPPAPPDGFLLWRPREAGQGLAGPSPAAYRPEPGPGPPGPASGPPH